MLHCVKCDKPVARARAVFLPKASGAREVLCRRCGLRWGLSALSPEGKKEVKLRSRVWHIWREVIVPQLGLML